MVFESEHAVKLHTKDVRVRTGGNGNVKKQNKSLWEGLAVLEMLHD